MEAELKDTKVFGFWIYLMTDLIIFASLFACFLVLRENTFNGPTPKDLYHFPTTLKETLALLTSSFTCSLGMHAAKNQLKVPATIWFLITFVLGIVFLYIEVNEFLEFIHKGAGWGRSAFLSSYFTLVGTHGFHISCGLLWMATMMARIILRPLNEHAISRIFRMSLFWHFLDLVWIFIFTIVYGLGYLYAK